MTIDFTKKLRAFIPRAADANVSFTIHVKQLRHSRRSDIRAVLASRLYESPENILYFLSLLPQNAKGFCTKVTFKIKLCVRNASQPAHFTEKRTTRNKTTLIKRICVQMHGFFFIPGEINLTVNTCKLALAHSLH